MSRRHLIMLLALAAIWGASFMLIKVGVRELEPSTLVLLRVVLAMLTLLPIVFLSGGFGGLLRSWRGRLRGVVRTWRCIEGSSVANGNASRQCERSLAF